MAFEPLKTDEKYDGPPIKKRDMDAYMLAGCSSFVFITVITYGLVIWPWLVFQDISKLSTFLKCLGYGLLPSVALGIYMIRKTGVAGACGFVGASMTSGIFLFLRLQQAHMAFEAHQAPKPEFNPSLSYLLPIAWVAVAISLGVAFVPQKDLTDSEESP